MPIYEFRCQRCRRRSSVFTRSIGGVAEAVCSHCGSREMSRLISKVAVLRSGDDAFAGLDESSLGDVDENDPRSMARWLRQMSRQAGEPLGAGMEAGVGGGGGWEEWRGGEVDENAPGWMGRWLRQMSRQAGEPLDAEMESELERMEAGETPEDFGDGGDDDDDGFGDVD